MDETKPARLDAAPTSIVTFGEADARGPSRRSGRSIEGCAEGELPERGEGPLSDLCHHKEEDLTNRPVRLGPSILTADLTRLGEQIAEAEAAGVDFIHLDVMDGR